MSIVIKNVKFTGEDGNLKQGDIKVTEGKIAEIGSVSPGAEKVIEGNGRLLTPGLVDVHVHLREPGGEHKETIETGTKAAARGGFTTICPMPNTRPVPDSEGNLQLIQDKIKEKALVKVLPYASITTRQLGKELVDFARLKEMGAFAFTDDGVGIQDASMMLAAMKAAARADVAIVAHCEENTLINKGSVHEGTFSEKHGLNGIPSVCESVHIARDVLLAEAAGAHYHVCHVSTKESVRVIRDAKRAGIHVTAEVSPHHLLLCDEDIPGLDPNFKMNPPLRAKEDRDALLEGLQDGTIDFIATDHAPHAEEEKEAGIEKAPFGIVGLETAFPLLYTHLVKEGHLSLADLVASLTKNPAEVFGLPQGTLQIGAAADLTLIDLEKEEKIDVSVFESKGKNTPFEQWVCQGWPVLTMVDGVVVYEKEEVFQ
ncbi:dihydroorotase [Bacillus sp. FJAT-44742]|uniref:dihydroorotase n=1 Tax=Bacillus sp. FJAT-44742 TaxID=2014005 RepID=UPI000C2498B7|nr:dihydroorotase [Bacillus sp. FJAT-44742]